MRAAASIVQEKDENILAGLQKRELNFNFRYRKQPAYPDSLWCLPWLCKLPRQKTFEGKKRRDYLLPICCWIELLAASSLAYFS